MPVPDFQSLMLPLLKHAAKGEVTVSDCLDRMAPELGLTEQDRSILLPSGRQTVFANRTHWAKFYITKAGLLEPTRRGHFRITERGRSLLARDPQRIDKRTLEQFPDYVAWWNKSNGVTTGSPDATTPSPPDEVDKATPEEQIQVSHAALMAALRTEVLERIAEASPAFFEQVIIDLLVALGYGGGRAAMGEAIGRSGDGGIDGIIKEDALGLDIVYIQAKRYKPGNMVGRPEVQSFAGSLDGVGATKGVFVTTSSFARPAKEYVERISKRIILIDGDELARLMIEYEVGVRTRITYKIKKVDEDYFSE